MTKKITSLRMRIAKRKANREREAKAVLTLRARLRVLIDSFRETPRVMFDDVNVDLIPKNARAVAGYVDGQWPTWQSIVQKFPHAKKISISVRSTDIATCLDVEPGDANNQNALEWFGRFHPGDPILYTSVSNADALVATLTSAEFKRNQFKLWTAHYGAGKHICGLNTCGLTHETVDATQWTSSSHSRSLDESVCAKSFWRGERS